MADSDYTEHSEDRENAYYERSDDRLLSEAEIDYALMGSFPASDPPAWTLGIERRQKRPREYTGEPPSAVTPSHHHLPSSPLEG